VAQPPSAVQSPRSGRDFDSPARKRWGLSEKDTESAAGGRHKILS